MDIVKVDPQAFQKNQKRHFFRYIEKSFQELTPIGPEPHRFFLFEISQQIRSLEASKVLAKMGLGWQADAENFKQISHFVSDLEPND